MDNNIGSNSIKKDRLNNINIMTQESEYIQTNSPIKEDDLIIPPSHKQKRPAKEIDIRSNYEIGFESEKSFYSSLEKLFNKGNFSNDEHFAEAIEFTTNDRIKELLVENKKLLQATIAMKERIANLEGKENKYLEKENLLKKQLDVNKKKVEQCDIYQNQLRERENYINELLNRYNALEKEYQQIIANKNLEIKDLNSKISLEVLNSEKLQNEINYLKENASNIARDFVKDINLLEEKNRDLENKLAQTDMYYSQQINGLKQQLEMAAAMAGNPEHNTINVHLVKPEYEQKKNNTVDNNNNVNFLRNSSETVVEMKKLYNYERQRTGEFAIDTNREEKNAKSKEELISDLNRISKENENLNQALKYEKETTNKLQQTVQELNNYLHKLSQSAENNNTNKSNKNKNNPSSINFKINSNIFSIPKEFGTQTILKMDEIDLISKKLTETENYLLEINENNDILAENLNRVKERNANLLNENKQQTEQIKLLINKLDKINNFNGKFTKEFLFSISNVSHLNAIITALKLREQELVEKLESYEKGESVSADLITKRSSSNVTERNNMEKNMNLPSTKNVNNVYSKKKFKSFQTETSPNRTTANGVKRELNRCLTFRDNFFSSPNNQVNNFSNNNPIQPLSVRSFKCEDFVVNLCEKFEFLEPRRFADDNAFLKDQNFKLISDIQKLNDELNSQRAKFSNLENEKNEIKSKKEEIEKEFIFLKNEISAKNQSLSTIDELKRKLNNFAEINTKLNENFVKMHEKVNQQNHKIIEKNTIIKEREKTIENLQNEKQSILQEKNTFSDTLRKYEKELETMRKPSVVENKDSDMIDKLKSYKSDNKKLYEKLKQKKNTINELYDELRKKDEKIKAFLQEKDEKTEKLSLEMKN